MFLLVECVIPFDRKKKKNTCMLIWFWNEEFLHHFCGCLVLCWKRSLDFLYIVFYVTFIPLIIWHTRWNNQFGKKSYMIFDSVDSWKLMLLWRVQHRVCYVLNTGNIFLVSKCFYLFSLQCCFRFSCCRWVPWNFCCILKM